MEKVATSLTQEGKIKWPNRGVELDIFKAPFQPKSFCDFMT